MEYSIQDVLACSFLLTSSSPLLKTPKENSNEPTLHDSLSLSFDSPLRPSFVLLSIKHFVRCDDDTEVSLLVFKGGEEGEGREIESVGVRVVLFSPFVSSSLHLITIWVRPAREGISRHCGSLTGL